MIIIFLNNMIYKYNKNLNQILKKVNIIIIIYYNQNGE